MDEVRLFRYSNEKTLKWEALNVKNFVKLESNRDAMRNIKNKFKNEFK